MKGGKEMILFHWFHLICLVMMKMLKKEI